MFLFPCNWENFPFFLPCRNNIIYRTTLINELSIVGNTITSLKQHDLLNVILYRDKNFESNKNQRYDGNTNFDRNSNQSILSANTKSLRSKRFNEWSFWAILSKILDNLVYKTFSKTLLFFYYLLFLFIKYTKRFSESLF